MNQNPLINTLYDGPTDLGGGGFEWLVEFKLPDPSEHYGWIVQQVTRTFDIKTADGNKVPLRNIPTYWEAWPVRKGARLTSSRFDPTADGRTYDDSFDHEAIPETRGWIQIIGLVKFYETDLPKGFRNNNAKTQAQSLYSTTTKPDFWDGTGTLHNLWAFWDSTPGNKTANILAQAGPQLLNGTLRSPDPDAEEMTTHATFHPMEAYRVPTDALFGFNRFDITSGAEKALQQAADYIKTFKGSDPVEIIGHTDSKGDAGYNRMLSKQRADAVAQWLISHKILGTKDVITRGAGATRPLVPNKRPDGSDDPDGRAKNRRVEIIVRT
jgi:outer membrane protein OmpA-like peptidoglycan-associated protein